MSVKSPLSSNNESSVANNEPLVSRLANDVRFHSVINRFIEKFGTQFDLMVGSWQRQDFTELAQLSHWLKGSGGTVGFDDFTKPAEALERFASEGNKKRVDSIMLDLQQLASRLVVSESEETVKNSSAEPVV